MPLFQRPKIFRHYSSLKISDRLSDNEHNLKNKLDKLNTTINQFDLSAKHVDTGHAAIFVCEEKNIHTGTL